MIEPYPGIINGDSERGYSTGYALRKGGNFNRKYYGNGASYTGCPILRSAEALLNYMEASLRAQRPHRRDRRPLLEGSPHTRRC